MHHLPVRRPHNAKRLRQLRRHLSTWSKREPKANQALIDDHDLGQAVHYILAEELQIRTDEPHGCLQLKRRARITGQ